MSEGQVPAEGYATLGKGRVTFFHFCQALSDPTLSTHRFVEALSLTLAQRFEVFADALHKNPHREITIHARQEIGEVARGGSARNVVIESLHIGATPLREAFDLLVRRPLEALYDAGCEESIVLLVDALEEAQTYDAGENLFYLFRDAVEHVRYLPEPVRLLFTCVPDLFAGTQPGIDLVEDLPPGVDDVYDYALLRLQDEPQARRERLASHLAQAARNNFLYARYVLDDAEALEECDSGESLPGGLEDVYRRFLQRRLARDEQAWTRIILPVLSVLAVARGHGLTEEQLMAITGLHRHQVAEFLVAAKPYLRFREQHGSYQLYHPSFRLFLFSQGAERFQIDEAEGNIMVAEFYVEEYRGAWAQCDEAYPLQHLPTHLMQAVRLARRRTVRRDVADKLGELLRDFEFLNAKAARSGVFAVLNELQAAVAVLDGFSTTPPELDAWLAALSQEAGKLRDWDPETAPSLFAQQLCYRLRADDQPDLAERLEGHIAQAGQPYFQLLWRSAPRSSNLERTLMGHRTAVKAVVVTPGETAISAGDDGFLRFWSLASGEELARMRAHEGNINCMALSADGRMLLTGGRDRQLYLWRVDETHLEKTMELQGHTHGLMAVAISRDGQHAASSDFHKELRIWDLGNGQVIRQLPAQRGRITSLNWLPDGEHVVMASSNRKLSILSLGGDEAADVWRVHRAGLTASAVSADGTLVLCGGRDGEVILANLARREVVWHARQHHGAVTALTFTPDGSRAISAGHDATLNVWDVASGALSARFTEHAREVLDVTVTADGRRLVSASADYTLMVFDLSLTVERHENEGHSARVRAVAITPDGHLGLTGCGDDKLRLWDMGSGQLVRKLDAGAGGINCVAASPDSSRALVAGRDGFLQVWDVPSGTPAYRLEGHRGEVREAAFTSDGTRAVSVGYDQRLIVWDLEAREPVAEWRPHQGGIRALALEAENRRALTGSFDRSIVYTDLRDGREIARFEGVRGQDDDSGLNAKGHGDWVNAVTLAAGDTQALSAGADGSVKLWEVETGALVREWRSTRSGVRALGANQEGWVFTGEPRLGVQARRIEDLKPSAALVLDEIPLGLALADEGATILVGDRGGNIYCLRFVVNEA
jgi:WD40 repeat protein